MECTTRSSRSASQVSREKGMVFLPCGFPVLAWPAVAPLVLLCRFFISHKGFRLSILSVGLTGHVELSFEQQPLEANRPEKRAHPISPATSSPL